MEILRENKLKRGENTLIDMKITTNIVMRAI